VLERRQAGGGKKGELTPEPAREFMLSKDISRRELMVAAAVPVITEWGVRPQGLEAVCKAFDYGTSDQRELMAAAAVVSMITHRMGCSPSGTQCGVQGI
jgi:hypothetical protein